MKKDPTYTANQVNEMAGTVLDYDAMKVLSELINEELCLYSKEDLEIITEASMKLFIRSLLFKFLK